MPQKPKAQYELLSTDAAIEDLLKNPAWERDEALLEKSIRYYPTPQRANMYIKSVFRHRETGQILIVTPSNHGLLHPSWDLCKRHLGQMRQMTMGPLSWNPSATLPYGKAFLDHLEEIIAILPAELGIEPWDLDYTIQSVTLLDEVLKTPGYPDYSAIEAQPLYAAVTAYVGEVARRQVDGQWVMIADDRFADVWEPYVKSPTGSEAPIAGSILTILEEYPEEFSLSVALHDLVQRLKAKPRLPRMIGVQRPNS